MPAAVNGMKECTKCGETKSVSEYHKKKRNKDGLRYACIKCCKSPSKLRWLEDNKEAINARARQRYHRNREKNLPRMRAYAKRNYAENREDIKAKSKAYRKAVRTTAAAAVYEIENRITGKAYVGQSTAWKSRWTRHKSMLSDGSHSNSSLQADYDEYGLDAFEHRVIQEYPCDTSSDVLKEHERETLINRIREGREVYNNLC